MIASNYRKHPAALALQLPLPFPHALTWQTARPGSRILRKIRAARAAAFRAAGRIAYQVERAVPAWCKEATARARSLAKSVKGACAPLFTTQTTRERRPEPAGRRGAPRFHTVHQHTYAA